MHVDLSGTPSPRLILVTALLVLWTAGAATAAEHIVQTNGLVFEPADLTIQVGDTVTWINADNGLHNVVADDGSFTSGEPSTASWQYSYTFHTGGSWGYSCEVHAAQGMTGTVTVEGIFGDSLESGDSNAWTETSSILPNCHCYFSGDCAGANEFCNWGTLTQEDNCYWRENKPNGVPGAGCDVDFPGTDWTSGICDGICTVSSLGSDLGLEDPDLLLRGIQLWAEALLRPAESGGGQVDAHFSDKAMALPFDSAQSAMVLGRQIGDMLGAAGIGGIDVQYCHHESHPGEDSPITPDTSEDPCLQAAGRLSIDALVMEIYQNGGALTVLDGLRTVCTADRWQELFTRRCPAGPDAIECFARRIGATAEFLSTPPKGALIAQ